ncbi:MAG: lasso peptide biosynthesis B2 protein [Gemmatimonadota bacterium]
MPNKAVRLALALEAAAWLSSASVLLRLMPVSRLFRELPPGALPDPLGPGPKETIERVRSAVGAAAGVLPWRPACLPKALAGVLMCRARGIKVPVALSVTNRGGFGAHARLDAGSDMDLELASPDGRKHLGRMILAF